MAHNENCRHLLGSLSDYVDGTAGDALCEEIERHLADCENCRVVVDTLKKTVYLFKASAETDQVEMPDEVKDRLFRVLHLEDYLKDPET
jgi:anti-sigma factor RsiW